MRISKIALTILVLSGIVLLSAAGCASKATPTPTGRVVTVQLGNLNTNITGVGNLVLSNTQDLAFNIPSSFAISSAKPITVQEVLVKAGDTVKEGQVLATLDTSLWDDQISALQDAVTKAQRAETQAERSVTTANLSMLQKQVAVNSAQLNLENTEDTTSDVLQLQISQANLEVAKGNLAAAVIAVQDAQVAVQDAQKAVETAQKAVRDAQGISPQIKAPFDGFITTVNVTGGTQVYKGTVAMTIADPNKFQANIMVSEMNMSKIKVGGDATVTFDSLPGIALPAKMTDISPTATIQSNVVNYQVKVEIQSLQPISAIQRGTSDNTSSGNATSRQFPTTGGGSANNTTPRISPPAGGAASGNSTFRSNQQATSATPTTVQLRQGLTATVSIIVQQRSNVLLVPNQAITVRQLQAYVQVQNADGTTEQRAIQTGINSSQYTEVTGGLSEGEKIIVPLSTNPTSTSSSQRQQGGGGILIPGMGR